MNQNNPFSGEKQCFCKKTRKNPTKIRRLKANCPKTHVQCGVAPNPKKKANKREKRLNRKRGCEKDHLKFAKKGRQKQPKKTRKPSPPQRRGHFWDRRQTRQKIIASARSPRGKFARARAPDTTPKKRF